GGSSSRPIPSICAPRRSARIAYGDLKGEQPPSRRDSRLELHDPDARRDPEAGMSGAARIHHRDGAVHELEERLVAVAVYDDLRLGEGLVQCNGCGALELIAVRHDNRESVELDFSDLRQTRAELRAVRIAVDGRHGRDRFERD